jgi:tol-pal system protein YbgF
MRLAVAPLPEERTGEAADAPRSLPSGSVQDGDDAPESAAVRQYRSALSLVRSQAFERALPALASFVRSYPDHPYADNARYWRGEVLYVLRRYREATQAFERVVTHHPNGNKAPDALLKMAECQRRTGHLEAARKTLKRLTSRYPDSVAARIASREDAS